MTIEGKRRGADPLRLEEAAEIAMVTRERVRRWIRGHRFEAKPAGRARPGSPRQQYAIDRGSFLVWLEKRARGQA